ncbi:BZ3500_MvSof-1268-A1-R1_Chr1-3g02386 [Microbotryum saponariae]|uniref:BZ3500_MvSof-1268-A1-R1_Chr1-3g02386 protein n=1 Tax=Microbotryum saponariae TaxID=289078 RepID=A0A2X0L5F0_9BASI|nr:BZ3500_MvSof-1268-A1-R1_Chr1-3g02386 [Microbotryum saponariae]SCZ96173.1 BZ3501_MvSof-1269-A2-R1_Chr1-3g01989 [Microbotryum saponariae]
MSAPQRRLQQVRSHFDGGSNGGDSASTSLARRYKPKLPAGLLVHKTPLNPVVFLLKAAMVRPHHLAQSHPEKGFSFTFSQFADRVAFLAYALKARGIAPGDRVVVLGPNVPFVSDALQAIPSVQGIIVALNTRLTEPEVAYMLENSGAKLALVDETLRHLVGKSSKLQVIICADSGKADDPYEKFLVEGQAYDRKQGGLGWQGLEFQADEDSTFAISYTSGTTSRPKGVETTYRGTYLAALGNAMEAQLDFNSVYLWILPQFHCLGWCFPYACTSAMATQVFLRAVGDYSEVWRGFLERGVTHYSGAPTVQLSIVSQPNARKLSRPLRTTVAGAAPTATVIEGLEKLGIDVTHVYGLTESYGPMTKTFFLGPSSPTYFVEKARQGFAFRVADDIRVVKLIPDGEELNLKSEDLVDVKPNGTEVGEIVMRGNLIMKGYWKNPEATAKAFAGGWFHTGDLAVLREDGTFAIADRSKDIIVSGAENISSLALESALTTHPDVLEVACVARAHEKLTAVRRLQWGERPHAFVVLKPGASWHDKLEHFENELKQFAKKSGLLPGFAIPEWVEVVHDLEKTSTGKIQKNVLRERVKKMFSK